MYEERRSQGVDSSWNENENRSVPTHTAVPRQVYAHSTEPQPQRPNGYHANHVQRSAHQQYADMPYQGPTALLRHIANGIIDARGWARFMGIVQIIFGGIYGALGILMLFMPRMNLSDAYKGFGTYGAVPALPALGFFAGLIYIALGAFIIYMGTLYVKTANHLSYADLSGNPEDLRSGLDQLGQIIRIQAILMLVGIVLVGLVVVIGVVTGIAAAL